MTAESKCTAKDNPVQQRLTFPRQSIVRMENQVRVGAVQSGTSVKSKAWTTDCRDTDLRQRKRRIERGVIQTSQEARALTSILAESNRHPPLNRVVFSKLVILRSLLQAGMIRLVGMAAKTKSTEVGCPVVVALVIDVMRVEPLLVMS